MTTPSDSRKFGNQQSAEEKKAQRERRLVILIAGILPAVGLLLLIVFSLNSATGCFTRIIGVGGLLAGASLASGALFGLLFSIPRSPVSSDNDSGQSPKNLANNNLIQISDWLTKALVGVSLTQLMNVPRMLAKFGAHFGPEIGSAPAAIAILIHFTASGFLSAYILTRIILQDMFRRGDNPPEDFKRSAGSIAGADSGMDTDANGTGAIDSDPALTRGEKNV